MDKRVHSIVIAAIVKFLNLEKQTTAIQTALATNSVPSQLALIITEDLKDEANRQIQALDETLKNQNTAVNLLDEASKKQQKFQNILIELESKINCETARLLNLKIDLVTGVPDKDYRSYNFDETSVIISNAESECKNELYRQRGITFRLKNKESYNLLSYKFEIASTIQRTNRSLEELEKEKKAVEVLESEVKKQMKELPLRRQQKSSPPNNKVAEIGQAFNYDSIAEHEIMELFVAALRGQIKEGDELTNALNLYDKQQLKIQRFEENKSSIVRILDEKIFLLGDKNKDKVNRIEMLKEKISKAQINEYPTLISFEKIITKWRSDHNAAFYNQRSIFRRQPDNDGQFIEDLLRFVRGNASQETIGELCKIKTPAPQCT